MKLSENFTLNEMTKSTVARRHAIVNEPNAETIENLKLVAQNILQPVRDHYGIPFSPSSGFRCLELNRKLNSKDTSQHVLGEAVDFEVPGISNYELAKWISENLTYDQLILECYTPGVPASGWVHASYKASNPRNSVLTYFGGGNYSEGLIA